MPDDTAVVPDVGATALDRADLEQAAEELGIRSLDAASDQQLFERVAVELGELAEADRDPRPPADLASHAPPAAPSAGSRPRTWSFLGVELHLGGFRLALDPDSRTPLARTIRWVSRATS